MHLRELYLVILVLISLLGGGACRKEGTATQTAPTPITNTPPPDQSNHPVGGVLSIPQTKFFKGSIGSRLGLQMKLTRDGEKVTGNYSYQKVGTKIELKGSIDKDNNLTLEEFDASGKLAGLFKGSWLIDTDNLVKVAGNWSKPNSEKVTAFSLHEEPIELTGGVELAARQLKERDKKANLKVEAEYPQATGAADNRFEKFNLEARNLVSRRIGEFKKQLAAIKKDEPTEPDGGQAAGTSAPMESYLDIGYDIAFAKDDLLSIQFSVGSYSGGAHPNSSSAVLNYDVKAGKVLRLADLFNPGARYLQTISSYCIKDLKGQSRSKGSLLDDDSIQNGAGPEARNYQSWTITRKGLEITFDAYQVGPYAAGPQTVVISYSALKDLIRADGPLAQFVK